MRPWTFTTRVLVPLALLGLFAGCGGGGSSVGGGPTTTPTLVTAMVAPSGPLNEYAPYTFTASAVDSSPGRTVASFNWTFSDKAGITNVPAVAAACQITHNFQTAGTFTVTANAVDDQGTSGTAASKSVTVVTAVSPVTVTVTSPAGPTTLQAQIPGTVQTSFTVSVVDTAGGATVGASNLVLNPGESSAVVGTVVDNGGGSFTIPVIYQSAATSGSRTVNPTVYASDSLGNYSAQAAVPAVTIVTSKLNHPATVTITTPAINPINAFTSKQVNLVFTLADLDGDVVGYTVDWGDGTPTSTGTTGAQKTLGGVSIPLTHTYADSFASNANPNPNTATVTVTANDSNTPAALLNSATTKFVVTYNTYPTATILSPQASGTLPTPAQLPSGTVPGLVNPPTATSPDLVVVPILGQLTFNGVGTLPGSGDSPITYKWTFQNGIPSTASAANAGQVVFNGVAGQLTPCLVTFTVTDFFGRASSGAPGANVHTYEKWVIVDGTNTQDFNLTFLYRQMGDNNTVASLAPVTTPGNGYGATVQIYQDGISSSWQLQSGNVAQATIPVRSNLPFHVLIPPTGADTLSYALRIPNAPTGQYADGTLVTNVSGLLAANAAGFGFQFPTAVAAPWNPVLQIVTGQGFAPEGSAAANQTLIGTVSNAMIIGPTPVNSRWLDRLSVPLTDPDGAIQWEQDTNYVAEFGSVLTYENFAEWPMVPLTVDSFQLDASDVNSTVQGKPADMGFNVNYATYANSDTQTSQTFMATELQAYRVPADSSDPYNLSNIGGVGWGKASCTAALNPTPVNASVPTFFNKMIYNPVGAAALSGGLQGLTIPYDPNDPAKTPLKKASYYIRNFNGIRSIFSYSEYIWSNVWARPMVLNSAQLSYLDTAVILGTFPHFRYSSPAAWPKFLATPGIVPDNSQFDLTAVGGPAFDNSVPVGIGGATPSSTGVGRFYWTAYTPSYNSSGGAVISRTWLANGVNPPTSFPTASATGDATSALGFVPPQDTVVDKRGRNADGTLNGLDYGGYRVTWSNPTLDASGNPVPPDFWAVQLTTAASNSNPSATTVHFMLPGGYPSAASGLTNAQMAQSLVLTDAPSFLPSGNNLATGPATSAGVVTDTVAPGYCWFDVPPELRPITGIQPTITVFALKAILRNNAVAGARAINRTEWLDAIKTATAQIKVVPSSAQDISNAHKVPFRYPWDIVVVNGPATTVAQ